MVEILTPTQKEIIKIFSSIDGTEKFYLTGGTALTAFYLYHRLSEDIDIFTSEEELILYVVDKFLVTLNERNFEAEINRRFKTFCEFAIRKEQEFNRIHIAYDSPFRLEPLRETELGIKIDSLKDIASNKLLTVFGRAELKDFIDVYFLVKESKMDLIELIAKAKMKDPGLDEYFLSIAFEQVKKIPDELEKLPVMMLKPLNIIELKKFFVESAMQLVDKGLK